MAIEIFIVAFLLVLGVVLLLVEIFLLPGITIAGIAGGLSLLGGVIYAFMHLGSGAGFISIGASVVIGAGAFVYLIKSNAMDRIALNTDIEAKVDQTELKKLQPGDKGQALSRLNPIGNAAFDGVVVEAKSINGEFIEDGAHIEIVKVETYNVLVKHVDRTI